MTTQVRVSEIASATIEPYGMVVRGATYSIRDGLKAAGFRFIGSLKQWEARDPGPEHLAALAALGVALEGESFDDLGDPALWTGSIVRRDLCRPGVGSLEVR